MPANALAGIPLPSRRRALVVREHTALTGLHEDDERDLRRFTLAQPAGEEGRRPPIFVIRNGRLHAENYVGIIETRRGTVIEILPKIDLSPDNEADTRRVFLTMLRDWRGLGQAQLDGASIRAIRRFDMFEAFVHLFLTSVVVLTRRGLARAYRTREANLPQLRGRILFTQHVRENLVDRSRFYVGYDEFTANRPANRLIHLALRRLTAVVRHPENRQRVHQLRVVFSDVPPSTNLDDDWARHRVDRSMQHYDAVMPWVGLFLFGHGLATFSGPPRQPCPAVSDGRGVRGLHHCRRPPTPAPIRRPRSRAEMASGDGRGGQTRLLAEAGHSPDGAWPGPIHPGCEVEATRPRRA